VLKGYADEHVASAIVQALRLRGMDIVIVQERQGEGTEDADVLAEALRDERAVLTCDSDFLVLADESSSRGQIFAPIFYWPQSRRHVGSIMRFVLREASHVDYTAACSRVYFL